MSRISTDEDLAFFQRELDAFVPDRIFDAHAHLWHGSHSTMPLPEGLPATSSCEDHDRLMREMLPGRTFGGYFLPWPGVRDPQADPPAINEWVGRCVSGRPGGRGAYLVRPSDDPERLREEVRRLGLSGLKCYHTFSSAVPTFEAEIPSYLPESLVRVAHEEGLVVTLHLVKSRAVADRSNRHWIRHYCTRYPKMKMILAHSARGFQPGHNLEGLPELAGLENLYFDASANCEPVAHEAILRIFGPRRLLYGSDFGQPSHIRGRSACAGDSFVWLYEDSPVWQENHGRIRPVPVLLESLRSLKWACWSAGMTDAQVEDIFWNNAAELFGISNELAA